MSTGATPRKPPADIYTLLLALALLAIIIATVFAFLEANSTEYGSPPYQGSLPRSAPALMEHARLAVAIPAVRCTFGDGLTSA